MASDPPEIFYFCDETSFTGEEYMAVGGITIAKRSIGEVTRGIKEINANHGERSEVKWNSTRYFNLDVRKAYADYLMKLIRENRAHFHIRFAPFALYDHNISGKRRVFDTVSKMYYQLLLHRPVRYYGQRCKLLIRPDDGECTSELKNFVAPLQIDGRSKYLTEPDCIKDLICLNSRNEPMLQLLDIMLGGLTSHRNGRHENGGEAKRDLATHIYTVFGVKDLKKRHDDGHRLSVWNVKPSVISGKRGPRS